MKYPAFTIRNEYVRANCLEAVRMLPLGWRVTFREPRRSDEQNDKMHAMCGEIAEQVVWCGQKYNTEQWKRIATATLKKQKVIPAIDEDGQPGGGVIVIGAATREMSAREVSEIIEWLYWFGAIHSVTFRERDMEMAP